MPAFRICARGCWERSSSNDVSVPKTHPTAEGELWLGRLGIRIKHDAIGEGADGQIRAAGRRRHAAAVSLRARSGRHAHRVRATTSENPMIAFSGVRSSGLMVARNSVFVRTVEDPYPRRRCREVCRTHGRDSS